ncbi:hypothetical protein [Desulfoluna butyratoxydans]|uniref:Nucleophile aminohydrolases n-terminal n=1 Tax=Desulfoluna butyratoxydans TaxID=231438 RepID=A0A4U8YL49_9BACT|nr:hypothetical protein [Desulfoluna butyratoxydans]VFQ44646.1 nucleophile aminohydrolases n-terminal [Desulfoluna butyratoxydans]
MKRLTRSLLITGLTLLCASGTALACTSFAVYAPQPIYGMNFDYARFPMKLRIVTKGDLRTFHLAFEKQLGKQRFFANTGGMNSKGLFYACQELHPFDLNPPEPGEGNLPLYLLNTMPERVHTVKEIEKACDGTHLIQLKGVTIHTLFADMTGRAMVVETGKKQNILSHMTGNYIAMANFPNHTLKGVTYTEAKGLGDWRYQIACRYLETSQTDFSVNNGLTLLEKAQDRDPMHSTACSMVFAPATSDVYIAFHADFSKIWKVSLMEGTIETFRGFKTKTRRPLDEDGLLISDLISQAT